MRRAYLGDDEQHLAARPEADAPRPDAVLTEVGIVLAAHLFVALLICVAVGAL